jgi:AAA15 family ATPase/GTPase
LRVHSISLKNFGPFKSLEEFRFGQLSTIIGQNDAGKSHILLALQIFLEDADIER